MKKQVSFRIDEKLLNMLKEKLEKEGSTMSSVLIKFIKKYVKK